VKSLYTLLYTLSIILINPWGITRGYIWTSPKVFIIWLIIGLNIALIWEKKKDLIIIQNWFKSLTLWLMFLGIGAISTLQSPFPERSFWGQDQMGDGWLYWCAIAFFTVSNSLLLNLHPQLLRSQLKGLLIGGIILAFSIFPQFIDNSIDYTATTGQFIRDGILASTIFTGQQPIGLYSHRGHAAIVLALIIIIAVIGRFGKLIGKKFLLITLALILPALLLTDTRTAIFALIVALVYLLGRKYYQIIITAILVGAIAISYMTITRPLDWSQPSIAQVMSSRTGMGQLSVRGIKKRPLLGWGFDGYGIAYPYIFNPKKVPIVVNLGQFSYDYINLKGQIRTREIPTYKAHNLILDIAVSVGILGLLSYVLLWAFYLHLAMKLPRNGMVAVAVAYLTFVLTWFECAQYAHIVWWGLSLGGNRDSFGHRNLS